MSLKYQVVADESMPGVDLLFGEIAEIVKVDGRNISAQQLLNADALLCRSVSQINSNLLKNTKVKFVGTATIGTDHLDIEWLNSNSIKWSNAAGCNAAAVAQYVLSAVSYWCLTSNKNLSELNIGIVGAGNVGSELSRCLSALGINYLLCDPPLESAGDDRSFVDLESILKCDVITLHVPLVKEGEYNTLHLFESFELAKLSKHQLLINASRGPIINNSQLTQYLETSDAASVVLDVFENEPDISARLIPLCLLATPHIAGHTLEGKLRGTWQIYKAMCDYFSVGVRLQESILYPANNELVHSEVILEKLLLRLYDIQLDSDPLKQASIDSLPKQFDRLRRNATQLSNGMVRRDYSGWNLPNYVAGLAK